MDSPISTKVDCPPNLEVVKYKSRVSGHDGKGLKISTTAPAANCKQHRDEILQLELAHLVEMNDLKALLACREMVHENEMKDLQQAHSSELDRVQNEAQSTTLTTVENAQTFFDQKIKALEGEHQQKMGAAYNEYKHALQQSRLTSMDTMHKLVESKETVQRKLEEVKTELVGFKSAFSDAETKWATETSHLNDENEVLRAKIDDASRKYEEKLVAAEKESQVVSSAAEEAKKQSQHELKLAQEESTSALKQAEERRFRLVKQLCDEKKKSEQIQAGLQDKVVKAESAVEELKQQYEEKESAHQDESQRLSATITMIEEKNALLEKECHEANTVIDGLHDALHDFESQQQAKSLDEEDQRALIQAKDFQIRELVEMNDAFSTQILVLQQEKKELTAIKGFMEKVTLAIYEEETEEAIGTIPATKGSKAQECTVCPKKSRSIRQLRRLNKSLTQKLTAIESTADKSASDVNEQQAVLQETLAAKEKEFAAVHKEDEAQLRKFAGWIKNLVIADKQAQALHEVDLRVLDLKNAKIASMTSDVEQVTELRLKYAALIDSTADNLSRKEPDLNIDCKYMTGQITLMAGFNASIEDLFTEETKMRLSIERERDEFSETNKELAKECATLRQEKQKIEEKAAKVGELEALVSELKDKEAHMEMYTSCFQNMKAALERDEEQKVKKAGQMARWSKVMLEEIGARFEKKKVTDLHKEVTKRVLKLEAEELQAKK